MTFKVNVENENYKKMNIFLNIIKTIFCRLILLAVSTYYIHLIACMLDTNYYYLLSLNLVILIDTLWVCIRKKGVDFKWFSPTYLAFSCQAIVALWIGSKQKYEFEDVECSSNRTNLASIDTSYQCGMFTNSLCMMLSLSLYLYLVIQIVARRYTPLPLVDKDHSVLLVGYITAAADIVDFSDYHNIAIAASSLNGVNIIWALILSSSLQFSFILTAKRSINYKNTGFEAFLDYFFGTEVWSIVLVFFTQELPYLIIRVILVAKNGIYFNISTLFFLLKNVILVLEDLRQIYIFYWEYSEAVKNKVGFAN